jgi:hypothetical protein
MDLTRSISQSTAGYRHTYFAILEEENGLPAYSRKGVIVARALDTQLLSAADSVKLLPP